MSAAVSGSPSDHVAWSVTSKVQVSPSSVVSQLVASAGSIERSLVEYVIR